MYELFVPEWNKADITIQTYTRNFSLSSEERTESGALYCIRFQIKDTIPAVNLKYNTDPKAKYYDKYDSYKGELNFRPFTEELTLSEIKQIIKLVKKSQYSKEKASEIADCIDIQVKCYIWFLFTLNDVRKVVKQHYLNQHYSEREYKAKIKVLKRTFDRYKKIKDRALDIRDEFERLADEADEYV